MSLSTLQSQVTALSQGSPDIISLMANIAALLHEEMGNWWTGFYRVMPQADGSGEHLVLGPFQGPLACMTIAYGRGVCGTAWREDRTIIVPDVDKFPGHIACSSASRSEIVVPIHHPTTAAVVAVLDIDSDRLNAFDDTTADHLQDICALMAPRFA